MLPRCQLGNDPAERLVRLILSDHRLRQDAPVAGDQRDRAVVARGFEAEDDCHALFPLPERRAMH